MADSKSEKKKHRSDSKRRLSADQARRELVGQQQPPTSKIPKLQGPFRTPNQEPASAFMVNHVSPSGDVLTPRQTVSPFSSPRNPVKTVTPFSSSCQPMVFSSFSLATERKPHTLSDVEDDPPALIPDTEEGEIAELAYYGVADDYDTGTGYAMDGGTAEPFNFRGSFGFGRGGAVGPARAQMEASSTSFLGVGESDTFYDNTYESQDSVQIYSQQESEFSASEEEEDVSDEEEVTGGPSQFDIDLDNTGQVTSENSKSENLAATAVQSHSSLLTSKNSEFLSVPTADQARYLIAVAKNLKPAIFPPLLQQGHLLQTTADFCLSGIM